MHRVPPHRHSQSGRPNTKGGKPNKYTPHMGKKQLAKAAKRNSSSSGDEQPAQWAIQKRN